MRSSPVITPSVAEGFAIRQMNIGTDSYDLTEIYPPDTGIWQSKVLDLGSPKFQPNATYIFDRSRYNNHGTIYGATWAKLPSGLWALSFDGTDDYVDCGDAVSTKVEEGNYCTLEGWAYLVSRGTYWGLIVGSSLTGGLGFGANVPTNNLCATKVGVADAPASGVVFPFNTWCHVAITYDAVAHKLYYYMNGQLVSIVDWTVTFTASKKIIGAYSTGNPGYVFGGKINLVRIYNRALSAPEITNTYNRERSLFGA